MCVCVCIYILKSIFWFTVFSSWLVSFVLYGRKYFQSSVVVVYDGMNLANYFYYDYIETFKKNESLGSSYFLFHFTSYSKRQFS